MEQYRWFMLNLKFHKKQMIELYSVIVRCIKVFQYFFVNAELPSWRDMEDDVFAKQDGILYWYDKDSRNHSYVKSFVFFSIFFCPIFFCPIFFFQFFFAISFLCCANCNRENAVFDKKNTQTNPTHTKSPAK